VSDISLVIAIPSTGLVATPFAYSLAGLVGFISSKGLPSRPESSVLLSIDIQESSVIHGNRENLVMRALERGNTHLLFLDHDMSFEPNIIDVMFSRRQPVVVTNYVIRSEEKTFVAVSLNGDRRIETNEKSTGMEPIAYSGFGVSLFDLEVFKKVPQPWFMPLWSPDTKGYTTEDNPAFERIRKEGFPVYLDHDASKLVTGHCGSKAYSWKDKT